MVFLLGLSSSSYAEDLLNKYKQKMDTSYTYIDTEISKSGHSSKTSKSKYLSNEIRIIKSMKKSTFESTQDFLNRREQSIKKLDDKMAFYIQNGSKEYSAGTVQMKHYNPDTQIVSLTLSWNKELSLLLSKSNLIRTTSFSLKREEAKKLFSDKKKHFFHIKLMHRNNTILVSEVLLYNKYILYKNMDNKFVSAYSRRIKRKPKPKAEKQNTAKKCKNYEVMATKLNIRNEPSKKSKILGKVTKGETICVYEFFDGWAKTDYGWISKSYVKNKNEKNTPKKDKKSTSSSTSTKSNTSSGSNWGFWIILLILFLVFRK
jgi:hypothetical protein